MHDTPESDAHALLLAAEERIMTAIRTRDMAGLEEELAPDFVYVVPGAEDQDRDAFLRAVRERTYWILDLSGEDLRVRVLGDVAIVSGTQRARVELSTGRIVTGATAFVDVFGRTNDGWSLRHAFGVEVGEEGRTE